MTEHLGYCKMCLTRKKMGKSKVSALVTFEQNTKTKTLKMGRLFGSQVHWAEPRIAWPRVHGKDIKAAGERMAEQTILFMADRQ